MACFDRCVSAGMVVALLSLAAVAECRAAPGDAPVRAALARVERLLDRDPQGEGWRAYLALDQLEKEMGSPSPPDVDRLLPTLTRLEGKAPGLERVEFAALREAVRTWQGRVTGAGPLAELARQLADQYHPLTEADLQAAKAAFDEALERLTARLQRDGANGEAWSRYLQIDELRQALSATPPDLPTLEALLERYQGGHRGLELTWFRDVSDSLRRYIEVARVLSTPNMAEHYRGFMLQLADALEKYAAEPTEELAIAIQGALVWLDDASQSPSLVAAAREAYQKPNMHAEISAALVAAGLEGPVDREEDVRDCILDTAIFGTGDVTGWTNARLIPSDDVALIELFVDTTTISRTVGYNGPVRIYSLGRTTIHVLKRLQFDSDGVTALPAVSDARTRSRTLDIQTKRGSRLVEWLAWRRSRKLQGRANAIAAQHAEVKANNRADEEAAERVAETNERYEEKLRGPLRLRRLFPDQLQLSTTESTLQIDGLQAFGVQLGAAFPAPAITAERPDMALQVHESLVHNVTTDLFAGRTVRIEDLQDLAQDTLGRIPPELELDEDREPWGITFARQRPVSVSFDDGLATLVLRADRFYQDDEPVQGMDVSVTYRFVPTPTGFRAERQGEVEVYPPGFGPGSGRRVPARLQAIRSVMTRRFSKVFPPTAEMTGFTPPGEWEDFGHLRPVQVTPDDEWLAIAWRKAEEKPADEPATP